MTIPRPLKHIENYTHMNLYKQDKTIAQNVKMTEKNKNKQHRNVAQRRYYFVAAWRAYNKVGNELYLTGQFH